MTTIESSSYGDSCFLLDFNFFLVGFFSSLNFEAFVIPGSKVPRIRTESTTCYYDLSGMRGIRLFAPFVDELLFDLSLATVELWIVYLLSL